MCSCLSCLSNSQPNNQPYCVPYMPCVSNSQPNYQSNAQPYCVRSRNKVERGKHTMRYTCTMWTTAILEWE